MIRSHFTTFTSLTRRSCTHSIGPITKRLTSPHGNHKIFPYIPVRKVVCNGKTTSDGTLDKTPKPITYPRRLQGRNLPPPPPPRDNGTKFFPPFSCRFWKKLANIIVGVPSLGLALCLMKILDLSLENTCFLEKMSKGQHQKIFTFKMTIH